MNKFPFGVKNKVAVPLSVKKDGALGTFGNKGFYGNYFDQLIYEGVTDHIWGTQAQVTANDATFYTDGSGNPLDASASPVTINDDEKILINHNATQTANLALDAGGAKITLEMVEGVTLDMSTYNLTLGGTGDSIGGDIRISQTGNLTINGNRGLKINNSVGVYNDFKSKNLKINVQSSTTIDADADNIIFIDEFGGGARINSINETYNITTDLMAGTSEKSSTWYQIWLDSAGIRKLAPDLTGTADSDVTSELRDSSATFQTDLVQVGDIVYNLTDLTQGTVVSVDSETAITLNADIFPAGTEDYKIRMLSPVGLGRFKARIGAVYNDSSSDFYDSTYTQIQEERVYSEAAGDFSITGTSWTTDYSDIAIKQVNDWTGKGTWKASVATSGSVTSSTRTSFAITISGTEFVGSIDQPFSGWSNATVDMGRCSSTANTGVLTINHTSATGTAYAYNGVFTLEKKPSYAI